MTGFASHHWPVVVLKVSALFGAVKHVQYRIQASVASYRGCQSVCVWRKLRAITMSSRDTMINPIKEMQQWGPMLSRSEEQGVNNIITATVRAGVGLCVCNVVTLLLSSGMLLQLAVPTFLFSLPSLVIEFIVRKIGPNRLLFCSHLRLLIRN